MGDRASGTIERGIRQDQHGLQAYVRIHGRLRAKRFPIETDLRTLRAWIEDQRVAGRHGLRLPTDAETFAADVDDYLRIVASMPTIADRTYRMQQWVDAFGSRARSAITSTDIRAQLARWRLNGRHDGGPLSPASLNQRRTALLHFFTVMDGKAGANPVKDVPPFPEHADDEIRALPWPVWYRLIARMGRGSNRVRRGFAHWTGRRERTKAQVRLRLMLWTGWPHAQIMALTPADIDWPGQRVRIGRRRKGKGRPPMWLPLLPPAVTALEAFAEAQAWGPFSQSALHSSLRRAVVRENAWRARWPRPSRQAVPTGLRPYDARHSALTLMATLTTDERALQDLALHSTARQTRRYTRGATDARLQAAIAQMTGRLR